MRKLIILILIITVAFAQTALKPIISDPRICTATEKLPGACYFLYKPVCGAYVDANGNFIKQTFANRCFACKSPLIQYVYDRPCSYYPANAHFCIPHNVVNYLCIQIYKPVCGYFNSSINCLVAPCGNTYGNGCVACLDRTVDYYTDGICLKLIPYPPIEVSKKP